MDTHPQRSIPSAKAAALLCALLTALSVSIYVAGIPFVDWLNLKIADTIVIRADQDPPGDSLITVVEIDEEALNALGQWPWPRYRLARLLQRVAQLGARSIGLAVILAEPDRTSLLGLQETILREFGHQIDLHKIPPELLDNDLILAQVLAQGPFVLGYEFTADDGHRVNACHLHPLNLIQVQNTAAATQILDLYDAPAAACNLNAFGEAVAFSGFLNGTPDPDGLLRRIPLIMRHESALYPNLALAVVLQSGVHRPLRLSQDGNGQLLLAMGERIIPLDRHGNLYIRFRSAPSLRRVSAAQIMAGKAQANEFQDRLVFIGLSASGLGARFPTTAGTQTSAVDIHAQAAESILRGAFIKRHTNMVLYEIIVAVMLALLYGWCLTRLGVAANAAFGGLGLLGLWLGAQALFQLRGVLFSPLLPASVVLTVGVALMLLQLWRRQRVAHRRQEDALVLMKGSEHRLNAIIQSIPDIVFRLDATGRITFISPAVMKYECQPAELMGKHILDIVAPEDRVLATHRINERRTGARATVDLEIKLLLANLDGPAEGSERYFSVSAEGIYTTPKPDKNHFVGTQGIARDITRRKQLESQLERSKKMEAIGSLAAGVAHDLNNILSGLVSYPELLLLDLPPDSPLRKSIESIQLSGQRAAAVVQDMLTIARQGIANAAAVNINHAVLEYLQSPEHQRLMKNHPRVHLETNLDESLLNVKGTAVHLSKIVMNLVHNAVEAMPAGGRVTIKTRNRYLDGLHHGYEAIPEGEYIRLSVIDEGIGIAAQDLTRIFEPFYTKKMMKRSGTGLGMTVVWSTVKDHGGYIDLRSREGEGTRFDIFLPATRDLPSQREARFVLEDYLGSEKILVVDDVPEQREIAEKMLSKLGYDVISVPSGESAEEYLQAHGIDLVVLDMVMEPGIDGLETYRRILKWHPHQKAIIASGYAESERVKELQALGAGAYIRKPYTLEKIGLAVRRELDRETPGGSPGREEDEIGHGARV